MSTLLQFLRFCIVGAGGMVVDFGITFLLKEKFRLNKYAANSIGFSLAVVNNFLWNKYWTFHDRSEEVGMQFLLFLTISSTGLLLNNGVIYLLLNRWKMNFYLSKFFATGVVTAWNFLANYQFTFHAG